MTESPQPRGVGMAGEMTLLNRFAERHHSGREFAINVQLDLEGKLTNFLYGSGTTECLSFRGSYRKIRHAVIYIDN